MKFQKMIAEKRQLQPPVEAYKVTADNLDWLNENVTKCGLISDLSGVWVGTRFGTVQAGIGHIVIVNENDKHTTMSEKKFKELYEVVRTDEVS